MEIIAKSLSLLVALEHLFILHLEMFRWTSKASQKAFAITPEFARSTKAMAANQGLYNGFLAAGLIWGAVHPQWVMGRQVTLFFLSCVVVAAVFGGVTVKRSILLVQGLPAALALLVTWLAT
jgi:putative membrane protein